MHLSRNYDFVFTNLFKKADMLGTKLVLQYGRKIFYLDQFPKREPEAGVRKQMPKTTTFSPEK